MVTFPPDDSGASTKSRNLPPGSSSSALGACRALSSPIGALRSHHAQRVAARMSADPQVPQGVARAEARPSDAAPASWVDDMPRFMRPYLRLMRLDRPIGAWLLF